MKKQLFLVLLFGLIARIHAYAQCDFSSTTFPNGSYTKAVTDYGATPNDPADNDYPAIVKAIEDVQTYINSNPGYYGMVIFPEGQYDIGELVGGDLKVVNSATLPTYTYFSSGAFQSLKNIKIVGMSACSQPKPIIKYKDGFKYGYEGGAIVGIGSIFRLMTPSNVSIQNLELDGNSENINYVGWDVVDANGYTPNHTGISIYASYVNVSTRRCVEVKDCNVHNFGYDGIYCCFSQNSQFPYYNGIIANTTISHCGRQNIALISGANLLFTDCEIKYAGYFGTPVYVTGDSTSAGIVNARRFPANINLNMEPNAGQKIFNVSFINSKILYDATSGSVNVVSDTAGTKVVDNLNFEHCTLKGTKYAIALFASSSRDFNFNNCEFDGAVLGYYSAATNAKLLPGEITNFRGCKFQNGLLTPATWTVVWSKGQMNFENCEFRTIELKPNASVPVYKNIVAPSGSMDKFSNCKFFYKYMTNNTYNIPRAEFRQVFFNGNNEFNSIEGGVAQTTSLNSMNRNENLGKLVVAGSLNADTPNQFNIISGYKVMSAIAADGAIVLGQYPCEYLDVVVGDGVALMSAWLSNSTDAFSNITCPLYINANTKITVRKGGRLRLAANVYLAGQIIVEDGGRIDYLTGTNIYYPGSLSSPNIIINSGGSVMGSSPTLIPASSDVLQPPAALLVSPNPCTAAAARPGANANMALSNNSSTFNFQVSPNPAHTSFSIRLDKRLDKFQITIIAADGKKALVQQGSGHTATVAIAKLAAGLYFVEVSDGVYRSIQRLVKQ